jgi:hypothetical protein
VKYKPNGTKNLLEGRRGDLTLAQKKTIAEYLRTGKKTQAYKSAHSGKAKWATKYANVFFKNKRIVSALDKALKESKFDDAYAIDTLKKITNAGLENIDITRPDTSLKALETYFKITGKMGQGPKTPMRVDPETQAKRMGLSELQASLKELDKKQKRILAIISGSVVTAEEGEIIE